MKEQIKAQKIGLRNEEIANLSDAELKPLLIRMLIEIVGYGHKIEEEVKTMQSEIKKNIHGIVKGRKLGLNSTIWNRRKK